MHFEIGQCLSWTAIPFPSHAAVVVGLGIFRIEPKRLDEILYGPVEVALVAIGEVDMKSAPGPVRVSRTDRRSDRSRP
jgi:hypothetical protein